MALSSSATLLLLKPIPENHPIREHRTRSLERIRALRIVIPPQIFRIPGPVRRDKQVIPNLSEQPRDSGGRSPFPRTRIARHPAVVRQIDLRPPMIVVVHAGRIPSAPRPRLKTRRKSHGPAERHEQKGGLRTRSGPALQHGKGRIPASHHLIRYVIHHIFVQLPRHPIRIPLVSHNLFGRLLDRLRPI